MRQDRDYSNTPGTYVFDSEHSRQGYHLNMFCMSLNKEANRERFRRDERAYLDAFPMSSQQRTAVLQRDWTGMLRRGGNIYYTFKLAIADDAREVYRHYHVPASNTAAGLIILDSP